MKRHPLDPLGYRFQALLARLNAGLHEVLGNYRHAWLHRRRAERLERRAAGVMP